MVIEEFFNYGLLLFALISIVITSSVVWRVEKKLDISYKFFLAAIVVFAVGIFIDILVFYQILPAWRWDKIIKALFIVLFSIGAFEMRVLILGLEDRKKE